MKQTEFQLRCCSYIQLVYLSANSNPSSGLPLCNAHVALSMPSQSVVFFILALGSVFLGSVFAEQKIFDLKENKNGILTRFESESAVPQILALAKVLLSGSLVTRELIGL